MAHLDEFFIQRFRGLRDLKLEKPGQVNLLIGNNNSGKTSVLEALSLFCDPLNWRRWYDVSSQRELASTWTTRTDRLIWLFPSTGNDSIDSTAESNGILLSASGSFFVEKVSASYEKFSEIISVPRVGIKSDESASVDEKDVEIESIKINVAAFTKLIQQSLFGEEDTAFRETITFSEQAPFPSTRQKMRTSPVPSQIVTPFSHRASGLTSQLWSEVVEADLKQETIKLLRFFDLAIEDVDIILPSERRQLLSIKHKKLGRAPLSTFGDGLRRVFTLATSIPRVKNGLLLIDELETAIHTKALEKTFSWLVNACVSNNIQLFATTHSLEAVDAILDAARNRADFVVYRLQQDEERTTAVRFDKEMVVRLREELGMEIR
jgi:AAA15 family ATPase/GTPase